MKAQIIRIFAIGLLICTTIACQDQLARGLKKTYVEPSEVPPSVLPSAQAPSPGEGNAGGQAPTIGAITASFVKPTTFYRVVLHGGRTSYPFGFQVAWSKDDQRDCGVVGPETSYHMLANGYIETTWYWRHPDKSLGGDCPNESTHPGVISVYVGFGPDWGCSATYPFGSAAGTAPHVGYCGRHR